MCHHSNSQEREARVQSLDSVQSEVNLLFFKPIIKDRLACNLLFLIPINRSLYNSVCFFNYQTMSIIIRKMKIISSSYLLLSH